MLLISRLRIDPVLSEQIIIYAEDIIDGIFGIEKINACRVITDSSIEFLKLGF